MGRANRKGMEHMQRRSPSTISETKWESAPMRILPLSPADGGAQESTFFDRYIPGSLTDKPSLLPYGPPLLLDDEDNPEAARLDSIAIGQMGTDTRGNTFQLLRASGEVPPKKLLLRCLDNGEAFWVDNTQQKLTVLSDSVTYGDLDGRHLEEWARAHSLGRSSEQAVLALYELGLWDMQVRDRDRTFSLIGNWTVNETIDRSVLVADLWMGHIQAREAIEKLAENVETYPTIERFYTNKKRGTLPAPADDIDRVRYAAWEVLVGLREPEDAVDEIRRLSSRFSPDIENTLGFMAINLLELDPRPHISDKDFLRRVGPLWRDFASFHLP